jgi:hypothetical protein
LEARKREETMAGGEDFNLAEEFARGKGVKGRQKVHILRDTADGLKSGGS